MILAKAAWVQVIHADATVGAGTLVVQADGARRYQYNPRLQEIMREIPKGTIYDRNGLPLATSNWDELQKHRAEYTALGIDLDRACPRGDSRYYPFGGLTFDLLGDLRTRLRWGASNTSFVERDSARRLRGYDDRPTLLEIKNPKTGKLERTLRYDYRELRPAAAPPPRAGQPGSAQGARPAARRAHVDRRAPAGAGGEHPAQCAEAGRGGEGRRGGDGSGDRRPAGRGQLPGARTRVDADSDENPWLDRARYGLYPPGSTFKVVTAMAALRKDANLAHKTL